MKEVALLELDFGGIVFSLSPDTGTLEDTNWHLTTLNALHGQMKLLPIFLPNTGYLIKEFVLHKLW